MKLKNKILTLIAGTLTTFALTSCNDFLDRDPLGQFTEDDAPQRPYRRKDVQRILPDAQL